jgi:poly-beta-1,6-N-acetyl-D-glucosamine synthase
MRPEHNMREPKLLVVTPAKNEADFIDITIASLLRQTLLPARWLIVDDGSTDDTPQIVERATRGKNWVTLIQKPGCAQRRVGLATVDAVKLALAQVDFQDYDYLCVIDADIELPPTYLAHIIAEFDRDETLGIAAGQVYELDSAGRTIPMKGGPGATAGAVKCWRRRCFEDIGGLIEEPGWDGIDQYQAAMLGWTTRTFDQESVCVLHLRQMGTSHKSIIHGRMRRGASGHYMGSHPVWMIASALFHVTDPPYVLASVSTLAGYFAAMLRGAQRINNPELIQFIRRKQISTLKSICRLSFARPKARNKGEFHGNCSSICSDVRTEKN